MLSKTLKAFGAAAVLGLVATAGTAHAGVSQIGFASDANLENTGVTFGGTLSYDDASNLLTINLSNTSGFQSVITGFYFNIHGNASATYNVFNNAGTSGVDESAWGFGNSLPPFGSFDAGAKLNNLSQQQVRGIDEGETGTFTFNVSGSDASMLKAIDFFTDENSGGGLTGAFAVRYQSVGPNAQLSDKVTGVRTGGGGEEPPPNSIPLPPAAWAALATMGLGGLNTLRRRVRGA